MLLHRSCLMVTAFHSVSNRAVVPVTESSGLGDPRCEAHCVDRLLFAQKHVRITEKQAEIGQKRARRCCCSWTESILFKPRFLVAYGVSLESSFAVLRG
ncbi:MAG: hypothetical protein LBQ54_05580 [Planctomycetaceae bacterium]|nr:hypothetical protein [Planctomycetaceae bacterium]